MAIIAALLTYPWVTLLSLALAYLVAIGLIWRRSAVTNRKSP
jgi:hypothetical protein